MSAIVACKNLSKSYGGEGHRTFAVRNVSLSLERGKFYCMIGRSGSGKTTLLRLLSGLESPDGGQVRIGDQELGRMDERSLSAVRRKETGFVFQDYQLLPEFTVEENICLPILLGSGKICSRWLEELLEALSLMRIKDRYPDQLSGGEQQRTAIGRAVVHRPSVLFADEPTGNLDGKSSEEVMEFLLGIHEKYGQTILLATHDMDVARCGDEILLIEDGQLKSAMEAGKDI